MNNLTIQDKEIWFIHGANASPTSFNYIKESLIQEGAFKPSDFIDITYDCQSNLAKVIQVLSESAPKDKQLYIIGHSLGGIIATGISQRINHFDMPVSIRGVITLSAPFGGSESADYLKWLFPHYHLFKSISTQNKVIQDMLAVGAVVPTLSLVTSSGNNPLMSTANDGVVTLSSQRALDGPNYIEVPFNHFEVLVSPSVVDHIKVFIDNK